MRCRYVQTAHLDGRADADVPEHIIPQDLGVGHALAPAGHTTEARRVLNRPRCILHQVLAQHVVRRPQLLPAHRCAARATFENSIDGRFGYVIQICPEDQLQDVVELENVGDL